MEAGTAEETESAATQEDTASSMMRLISCVLASKAHDGGEEATMGRLALEGTLPSEEGLAKIALLVDVCESSPEVDVLGDICGGRDAASMQMVSTTDGEAAGSALDAVITACDDVTYSIT